MFPFRIAKLECTGTPPYVRDMFAPFEMRGPDAPEYPEYPCDIEPELPEKCGAEDERPELWTGPARVAEAAKQIAAARPKRDIFAFISVWVSTRLDTPRQRELRNFTPRRGSLHRVIARSHEAA